MSENKVTVTGRFIGGGLFDPRNKDESDNAKPKYNACVVLDEGQAEKVEKIIAQAVKDKWAKKPAGLQNWGVRVGDDEEYEASFEHEFINPKSTSKPRCLVRREGFSEEVSKEDDIIYPGCYVAISVSAYAYEGNKDKSIKPGVTLNLRGVMFLKDGERLGDVFNADDEFKGLESETANDAFDDFLGDAA